MNSTNTINLSNGYEEVITELQKIVDSSKEFEQKNIEQHSLKLDQGLNKETEANNRKNKRLDVLERREEIQNKRYEAFLQAQEKTKEAKDKHQKRMSEWATLTEESRKSNIQIARSKENIATLNEEYTQESLERKTEILTFERENVDVDIPILIQVSDSFKTIQWRTNYMFIRDICGEFLDYNFGKFDVTIRLINDNGSYGMVTKCEPVGEDNEVETRLRSSEYPHPHISSDNVACLGAVLHNHILERVRILDVSDVIVRVSEFLSHYNKSDAYTSLESWVPNKADCGTCHNCRDVDGHCDCTKCYQCYQYLDPKELNNCGICYTCCMRYHKYKSLEDHQVGLNGSQCFPK